MGVQPGEGTKSVQILPPRTNRHSPGLARATSSLGNRPYIENTNFSVYGVERLVLLRAGQIYWQWDSSNSPNLPAAFGGARWVSPSVPVLFLGQVGEDQGKFNQAAEDYTKAVALHGNPPNPAFREALDGVQRVSSPH